MVKDAKRDRNKKSPMHPKNEILLFQLRGLGWEGGGGGLKEIKLARKEEGSTVRRRQGQKSAKGLIIHNTYSLL